MKKLMIIALGASVSGGAAFADAHMSGDAEAGEDVFRKCKSCHMVVADDGMEIQKGGRVGPNLYGVYQRQAGSLEDYSYGDSIVAAGEAGLEWNEEDFVAYVQDPKGFLAEYLDDKKSKSKMSFRLRDEQDAKDVWAYLVSVGPEVEKSAD